MSNKQNTENLRAIFSEYCQGVKKVYEDVQIHQKQFPEEHIALIEKELGFQLNDELKEWFCILGEAKYGIDGFLMGVEPYSIDEMYSEWKGWREFDADEELNDSQYYSSYPAKKIKCRYTNPKWIPLGHTYDSNYIGVDLDPDVEGTVGQIIDFGRDQNEKTVLASSIADYLQKMVRFQDEMFVLEDEEGDYYINNEETHAIDWAKEVLQCEENFQD